MLGGSRSLAALLATVLVVSPALAEPKPLSDKDRQAASELVKKAIARSQAGDHEAAIVIYLQAYSIVPNSALLSNIGAEYQQDGKLPEALRYFCKYLEKEPDGANAPYATTQARLLHKQLGRKHVDDDELCTTPQAERKPAPPKDDEVETTEPQPEPAVASNGNATLKYAGLITGLVGLAATGVGIYEGALAWNITNDINAHPKDDFWDEDIRAQQARGQRHENLQIGFLIAGGVLVSGGVVMYLLGRSSERAPEKTVVRIRPTTNGFAVFGRF